MVGIDQRLLTFSIGNNGYGIPILEVKELIGMMEITTVPKTPEFIKGIINLRGKIIPVMDLRIKFGIESQEYDERTCIIVVEVRINGVKKLLGVVVDTVSEVVTISEDQVEPPPEYGLTVGHNSILGIGKIKDRVVIILDINEVFACEEILQMIEKVDEQKNIRETENV